MRLNDPITCLEEAHRRLESGRLQRALAVLPEAGRLPAMLRPERNFLAAEAWRSLGFFSRAEKLYKKVLTIRQAEDPSLYVEACLGSAAGLRSLGAVPAARSRLALGKRVKLRAYIPRLSLEEALIERAAGRCSRSILALRKILRLNLAASAWADAAFALWAIGGAERFRGRLKESQAAFHRSLALARRAQDQAGEGYACFGLGGVLRIQGRLKNSARYYALANRLFARNEDLFARAYAFCGLANALRQQGRLSRAEALYRKSYALYSRLEDQVDLAYVDWGLGRIHLQRGDLAGCMPFFRKALSAFKRHGETRGIILAQISLAQALHARGKTLLAEKTFAHGYGLARKNGLHAHIEIFT